jgi:hypothetical protein
MSLGSASGVVLTPPTVPPQAPGTNRIFVIQEIVWIQLNIPAKDAVGAVIIRAIGTRGAWSMEARALRHLDPFQIYDVICFSVYILQQTGADRK